MSLSGQTREDLVQELHAADRHAAELRARLVRLNVLEAGPTHVNGQRDPANPCTAFVLGAPTRNGDCSTDGHYVCDECIRRKTCACGQRPMHCACEL